MFFANRRSEVRRARGASLLLLMCMLILLTACGTAKGSIIILETPSGKGFSMAFHEHGETSKCELSANAGDELLVEITRDAGRIDLTVQGKNGSEPYSGNDLQSGRFTVTVSETDDYVFELVVSKATGVILVKNLGKR